MVNLEKTYSLMKNIRTTLLLLAAAWGFAACTNDDFENPQSVSDLPEETVTVRFCAESTIEETKATLTPNEAEDLFTAAWETTDCLGVYTTYNGTTKKESNAPLHYDGRYFSGELKTQADVTAWNYYAYYPYQSSNSAIPFGESRTQRGNTFNGAYDLMIGTAENVANALPGLDAEGRPVTIAMQRQTAILYFHFTTEEAWAATEKVTRVELSSDKYISGTVKFSDVRHAFEIGSANRQNAIALTFEEGTAPAAADLKAYFNIFTASSNIKLTLTVYTEGHKLTLNKGAATYAAGKLYRIAKSVPAEAWQTYTPGPLPAPELTNDADHVSASSNAVTVKWPAVSNAAGYAYSYVHPVTNETVEGTVSTPAVTIDGLASETAYAFTLRVKALGDGADYQDSPESSQTYDITTASEPVGGQSYVWDFETIYPEAMSSFTGDFEFDSAPAGCSLKFNAANSSVTYDAKWLNGSKCRLKIGGKSTIKNGEPTTRYFEFTATKSGKLTIVHQAAGTSGERHTLIRVGSADPISVLAPSGYVEENTYESEPISVSEPTRILIYFDNGINLNRIGWAEQE